MKKTFFLITLFLTLPTVIAAQTLTRERRTVENQSAATESSGVRSRVVGARSNHAESQKSRNEAQSAVVEKKLTQDASGVTWGNTAVIIRPAENLLANGRVASLNRSTTQAQQPGPTLVQSTSQETQSRASKTARALSPTRPTAATAAYHVGVGDVLDVRLQNLPTRESDR